MRLGSYYREGDQQSETCRNRGLCAEEAPAGLVSSNLVIEIEPAMGYRPQCWKCRTFVVVNVARRDLGSRVRSPVLYFCGVRPTRR